MSKIKRVDNSTVLKRELDGLFESLVNSKVAISNLTSKFDKEYTQELLYDWQMGNHPEIAPALLEALAVFIELSNDADENRKNLHHRLTNIK